MLIKIDSKHFKIENSYSLKLENGVWNLYDKNNSFLYSEDSFSFWPGSLNECFSKKNLLQIFSEGSRTRGEKRKVFDYEVEKSFEVSILNLIEPRFYDFKS